MKAEKIIIDRGKTASFSLGGQERKIFLKGGFYPRASFSSPLHSHHYAEIHMVLEGEALLWVEGKTITLKAGQLLLIPAKLYHKVIHMDQNTAHSAFGINFGSDEVVCKSMNLSTMKDFYDLLKENESPEVDAKLFSYVLLVCSILMDSFKIGVSEYIEEEFLIAEFFSENYYQDIQVSDLANALHLSEKQTQMLVKQYTGKTFKQELTSYRMKMADYLIQEANMSMQEVAEKVGFQSYSGFWKVYKAYKATNNGVIDEE